MENLDLKEEKLNAISHGLGIVFALISTPFLFAGLKSDISTPVKLGLMVYSLSFLMVFLFSTLYHAVIKPNRRRILRIFDHISIFLLIGGTQLPLILIYAEPNKAFWFLTIQWIIILFGIVKKIFLTGKHRLLSSLIYVGLGCMPLFLGLKFWNSLPTVSLRLLIGGGLTYLAGVIFYQYRNIPHNHFIWHIFVLVSAIMHWFGVYYSY